MAELIILGLPFSNFLRSLRMLAEEKGVAYRLQPEKPHSEAVKAIHPFGKIPVLRHGDTVICETWAMARYIDSAFEGPRFFPEEPAAAANVDEWVSLHNTLFDRTMVREYLLPTIFPGEEGPDRDRITAALGPMEEQLRFIAGQVDSGFVAQGRLTFADLALYPTLYYMTQAPESAEIINGLPALAAYIEAIGERESAKATYAAPPGLPGTS